MTFSLVGRCERTGAVGTVIASASVASRRGARRSGASGRVARARPIPGARGLWARSPRRSRQRALVVDRAADIAYRQLAIVDAGWRGLLLR